jgi:hypothetical protein
MAVSDTLSKNASEPRPGGPGKVHLRASFKRALLGLFSPARLWRALRAHRDRRKLSRTSSDEGLKLYADVLRGDFIHFGYFADPNTDPREISLADLERAFADAGIEFVGSPDDAPGVRLRRPASKR